MTGHAHDLACDRPPRSNARRTQPGPTRVHTLEIHRPKGHFVPHWFAPVYSYFETPGLDFLSADLMVLLGEKDGVTLEDVAHEVGYSSRLTLDLRVEAASPEQAKERVYAWLENALKGAEEWRRQTGIVFDDEVTDDETESWEVGQLFQVGEVSEIDQPE